MDAVWLCQDRTTGKRMAKLIISLTIVLYIFVSIVEARLIRTSGRGTFSGSAATEFFLIDDSFLNALGIADNFNALEYSSLTAGFFSGGATPQDCYRVFSSAEEREFEEHFNGYVEEPCSYEFTYGETLRLDGWIFDVFSLASMASINWRISGMGNSWDFIGMQTAPNSNELFLETLMPSDLLPGHYTVSLSMTFYSGASATFAINDDIHNDFPTNCGELIPGDDTSFTCAYDYRQLDMLTIGGESELLRVLPAWQVSNPSTITLFCIPILLLAVREKLPFIHRKHF